MWYIDNIEIVNIIILKIIPGKVVTRDVTFKKLSTLPLQKLWWNTKNKRTNSKKYVDAIKIFLTLSDFVTPCL